jgi:hypothetical protein
MNLNTSLNSGTFFLHLKKKRRTQSQSPLTEKTDDRSQAVRCSMDKIKMVHYILFCMFSIFINANQTIAAPSRSPAVEPITSLPLKAQDPLVPNQSHYFDFNQSTINSQKYQQNFRSRLLKGDLASTNQQDQSFDSLNGQVALSDTITFFFLCGLILIPLLIRFVLFKVFIDRANAQKNQSLINLENKNAEIILLEKHRVPNTNESNKANDSNEKNQQNKKAS